MQNKASGYLPAAVILVGFLALLTTRAIDSGVANEMPESQPGTAIQPGPAEFSATLHDDRLTLVTHTASDEHERQLLDIASKRFTDATIDGTFKPNPVLPPHWTRLTTQLLTALSDLRWADARIGESSIIVRGIGDDREKWASDLASLRDTLPGDLVITSDTLFADELKPLTSFCDVAFEEIANGNPVEFRRSSSVLRSSSFAKLDRLIDLSHDCSDTTIAIMAITADSDASNGEQEQLALRRAEAVADHLVRGGIRRDRLIVTRSVDRAVDQTVSNNGERARQSKPRIEFELRHALR